MIEEKVAVQVRITRSELKRLDKLAKDQSRSRAGMLMHIVRQFLSIGAK